MKCAPSVSSVGCPGRNSIKIIDSSEVAALALPGGYLYVTTGLIQSADSEAELAGMMAHGVAHVAARHAMRMRTREEIAKILTSH